MKIVMDAQQLRQEIQQNLSYARELRLKGIQKWLKKLDKYVAQVHEQAKNPDPEVEIKMPPYPPTNQLETFERALKALALHTENAVSIDSKEYNDLLDGFERVIVGSVNYLSTLGSEEE